LFKIIKALNLRILCAACRGSDVNVHQEEANLDKAIKELEHARELMKVHLIRTQQDIKRRQERASILATTGGSPGMMC
jgi:hypothetical protein